jgi:hypothetical protein
MGLRFVCLAAHDLESRRWVSGVDPRVSQTFAASPAKPGELPFWFRNRVRTTPLAERTSLCQLASHQGEAHDLGQQHVVHLAALGDPARC